MKHLTVTGMAVRITKIRIERGVKRMAYECIILEKKGSIATMTLNRTQVLNALNYPMCREIIDAIDNVAGDEEVRALVITGAGRSFCSGDDLKGMGTPPREGSAYLQQKVMKDIRNLRKPVIAAVNGNAHGAGSDIMLSCDFRIASEDAKLGDLRSSRALLIGTGTTYLLPALVGLAKAIELIFTGDMIDAKEAERIGLVNKTVPVDRFMGEVMALADKLAQGPTKVIGIAKAEIYRELNMSLAQALEDELTEMGTPWSGDGLWLTIEDTQEGRKSFHEKRKGKFTGK